MKILFKLTFKREIVTSLFECNLLFLSSIICKYYCYNIIVNTNFFSTLNVSVNNTLKYYDGQVLNEKLKLMGAAMNFFKKVTGPLASWSPELQNIFVKICKNLPLPFDILNVHCLSI